MHYPQHDQGDADHSLAADRPADSHKLARKAPMPANRVLLDLVIQVEEACQSLKEIVTLSKLLMHADVQQVAFRAQKAKLVHMISVALCRDACSLHNMLTVVP